DHEHAFRHPNIRGNVLRIHGVNTADPDYQMIDVGPRTAARDRVEHPPLVRGEPVELLAHNDLALLTSRPHRSLGIKFRDALPHALSRPSTPHVSVDRRWRRTA